MAEDCSRFKGLIRQPVAEAQTHAFTGFLPNRLKSETITKLYFRLKLGRLKSSHFLFLLKKITKPTQGTAML